MSKRGIGSINAVSIPTKLRIAAGLAIVGIFATFYAGYSGVQHSDAGLQYSITTTGAIVSILDGDMMHDALRADVLNSTVTAPGDDTAAKDQILADVEEHGQRFLDDIKKIQAMAIDDSVKREVTAAEPVIQAYFDAARQTAATNMRDYAAGQAMVPTFLDKYRDLETRMATLDELIQKMNETAGTTAQADNAGLMNIIAVASALAGAIILISNLLISRSITKPLTRVRDAIKQVVVGNLGGHKASFEQVSNLRDDVSEISAYLEVLRLRLVEAIELEAAITRTQTEQDAVVEALSVGLGNLSTGNLSQSISTPFPAHYETLRGNYNTSVDRLNQTITEVVRASRSIRGQSDEISHASEDLARRTENQAATLEETAAALDELTTSVKSAANSARDVETIVQAARREAEDSGKVVLSAVDAMNGIEKSSDQISQIIGVIDDIAFQTNLLALNAGVEAARAGDAGRGFAVVASEVRALAQRSSDASKEIKTLISSSSQLVGRGVQAVGSAGKALTTMVERVANISNLVSAIAVGAQEQSIGLGEVNVGVNQLDQVAQKNAAMVEQSMLATQSLREEAIGLDGLVTHFKTKPDPASDAGYKPAPRLRAVGQSF